MTAPSDPASLDDVPLSLLEVPNPWAQSSLRRTVSDPYRSNVFAKGNPSASDEDDLLSRLKALSNTPGSVDSWVSTLEARLPIRRSAMPAFKSNRANAGTLMFEVTAQSSLHKLKSGRSDTVSPRGGLSLLRSQSFHGAGLNLPSTRLPSESGTETNEIVTLTEVPIPSEAGLQEELLAEHICQRCPLILPGLPQFWGTVYTDTRG